ncbi:hypothetical protein L1049_001967 [Liquidambar formosana]|uniref:Transmembrane protein n=1 Tax=Liquidambar formosana TaxID=63359 RepID=A0AAP0R709_LIQFO
MENTPVMMKEKLEFFGILKEALIIPHKNPNFIIFTFITSFPLFCFLLIYETIFQQTLIETAKILKETLLPACHSCSDDYIPLAIQRFLQEVSHKFFLLGILYLGILHFLDLLNAIATIDAASIIYGGENPMNLKDMLCRPIKEAKLKGPLITSIYILLLASLILFGLFPLAVQTYFLSAAMYFMEFFTVLYGLLSVALLTKYLEWNAIWNMGIVISVLEEKQGDVALVISSYLTRGRRQCGLLLTVVFFVFSHGLRLLCLYVRWHQVGRGIVITAVQICLMCVGNVMKWVVFVVYFYDCKKRNLEKKVDGEEGRAVEEGVEA